MAEENLESLLRRRGFCPVKAALWAEFTSHVLQTFKAAAVELCKEKHWMQFIGKKGARARRKVRTKPPHDLPLEDALTSELGIYIQRIRRRLPAQHFLRLNEVAFHVEFLVASDTRAGRNSKRTDFYVCSDLAEDAPDIAIEAKPLTSDSDIRLRYCGAQGLGSFLDLDSPYTRGPLGGMLAYGFGSGEPWRRRVVATVQELSPVALEVLDSVIVVGHGEVVACSCHARTQLGLAPITMLHFELRFAAV